MLFSLKEKLTNVLSIYTFVITKVVIWFCRVLAGYLNFPVHPSLRMRFYRCSYMTICNPVYNYVHTIIRLVCFYFTVFSWWFPAVFLLFEFLYIFRAIWYYFTMGFIGNYINTWENLEEDFPFLLQDLILRRANCAPYMFYSADTYILQNRPPRYLAYIYEREVVPQPQPIYLDNFQLPRYREALLEIVGPVAVPTELERVRALRRARRSV
jgi:hypothetical protein